MLENRSVTKNATEVDGGVVGWGGGHWCGAAVPTMMETVAQAQAQRLFEACSASIAAGATNLIGIYESDNGRKRE